MSLIALLQPPEEAQRWLVRFKGASALCEVRIIKAYGRAYKLDPEEPSIATSRGIYERGVDFEFVERVDA